MEFMILSGHDSVIESFLKPTDRIMTGQNHKEVTRMRTGVARPAQILKHSSTDEHRWGQFDQGTPSTCQECAPSFARFEPCRLEF
jgi:hypothetical protein